MDLIFFGIAFVETGAANETLDILYFLFYFLFPFVETGAAHETSHHLEQLALEHVTLLLQGLRPKIPLKFGHIHLFHFVREKFLGRLGGEML